MIVKLWTRIREMGDDNENNVITSGYEKSGVQLAWFGCEDLVSVWLQDRSRLIPAESGMVHRLAHEILQVPISYDDLPRTLSSLLFLSSILAIT